LSPKKTLLIIIILLFIFTESVIAIPKIKDPKPPKIPKSPKIEIITFNQTASLGAGNIFLGNQEITETGVLQIQDAVSQGKINGGDTPISGFDIVTSLSGTLDLKTYFGSYTGLWTITGKGGTFEGEINGKVSVATIYGKFTGYGTSDYDGEKIKGTFEGSIDNYQIEITIYATMISKKE